jgi:hypothetical protein
MSKSTKWIGVTLLLSGMVIGAQYVRAAVGHGGSKYTTTTTTIAPEELTRAAGPLPVTEIASYF